MTIYYDYFANGWLKAVRKGGNAIASYSYDTSGNRTGVTFGNLTYENFEYDTDPRYRLASIDYAYGCDGDEDIEVRGTLDLTRDNAGNPLTWGNADYKKGYTYDDNNRLKTAALPGNSTVSWEYDWVGNRSGTGISYNNADQMTASPGKSYTYDGNGSMLTGTMAFSYTYTNLVAEAGATDMAWDSMGNRMSFTTSGSATYQFVYDPTAGIPAVLEEVTPGGSVFYVREPNGGLICRLTGENQTPAYYHFDELGSTLFLTDPDGILTDKYTYDAWGNVTSHTGSTSQPYQYVGQLGYYNHYQESGFKLMQLGVRLYDPEVGRFDSRDPVQDGLNRYQYTPDNPMFYVDPTGRMGIVGGVLIGVGGWFGLCGLSGAGYALLHNYLDGNRAYPGRDKLIHCMAACVIRKCGTIVQSWLWGWIKELWDFFFSGGVDPGDLAANGVGEACAKVKDTSCVSCCKSRFPPPCANPGLEDILQ